MSLSADAFQKRNFYAAIGLSNVSNTCCVYVDIAPADQSASLPTLIHPSPRDYTFVVHTVFTFSAARRSSFSTIISNLYSCEIYPRGEREDFMPPTNPDNRFYVNLPLGLMHTVIDVVRHSIKGLSIGVLDGKVAPIYSEIHTPTAQLNELLAAQTPNISLNFNGVIVIESNRVTKHEFKSPAPPAASVTSRKPRASAIPKIE
jgi:hypothetical protein